MLDEILDKYGDEYISFVLPNLPKSDYGNLESMVLYCFVRDCKPENVAEIGTEHKSRSSYIIESALQRNGLPYLHIMADLPGTVEVAAQNLSMDLSTNVKILSGLIEETYVKQKWDDIDFLFIDANHRREFAEWYFQYILPRICEGTPIHIHDLDLYANWEWLPTLGSEAEVFLEEHKDNTLCLEKLFWMFDYYWNPEYKPLLEKLQKKFPKIEMGKQRQPLPFKSNASYWRKI